MARKTNWNFRGLRKENEHLKETEPLTFFKNVIQIESGKKYSLDQKIEREKRKDSFNRYYTTQRKIVWNQIGQSDLHEVIGITEEKKRSQKKKYSRNIQFSMF